MSATSGPPCQVDETPERLKCSHCGWILPDAPVYCSNTSAGLRPVCGRCIQHVLERLGYVRFDRPVLSSEPLRVP